MSTPRRRLREPRQSGVPLPRRRAAEGGAFRECRADVALKQKTGPKRRGRKRVCVVEHPPIRTVYRPVSAVRTRLRSARRRACSRGVENCAPTARGCGVRRCLATDRHSLDHRLRRGRARGSARGGSSDGHFDSQSGGTVARLPARADVDERRWHVGAAAGFSLAGWSVTIELCSIAALKAATVGRSADRRRYRRRDRSRGVSSHQEAGVRETRHRDDSRRRDGRGQCLPRADVVQASVNSRQRRERAATESRSGGACGRGDPA
jgi:hypothetical protein